ncbi:MAG TPA: hypothetical protein VGB76_02485, partial [Pyrinomonadaceae bacterium]
MKVTKLFVLALVAALAALVYTPVAKLAVDETCTTDVVTEGDIARRPESTPPTAADDWVLYTRTGTAPTAGAFVNGPATPPAGAGSLQLQTNTGSEKVFIFNYEHEGTR